MTECEFTAERRPGETGATQGARGVALSAQLRLAAWPLWLFNCPANGMSASWIRRTAAECRNRYLPSWMSDWAPASSPVRDPYSRWR